MSTDIPVLTAMTEALTTETRVLGAAFHDPIDRCALRYGVATGPWQRAATAPPDLKGVRSAPGAAVTFEWLGKPGTPGAGSGRGARAAAPSLWVWATLGAWA